MIDNRTIQLISNYSDRWWLDSGSLLGLTRDGHFLEQDEDIDIGIVIDSNKCAAFIDELMKLDYKIVIFSLNNCIYKIKAIPRKSATLDSLILDLQIYLKLKNQYICPQIVFKERTDLVGKIFKSIVRAKKGSNSFFSKHFKIFFSKKKQLIKFKSMSKQYNVYFWHINSNFVESPFKKIMIFQCFSNVDNYLTFRYGDWHHPVKNWNFTIDDKGISIASDDELKLYEHRKK